MGTTSTRQVQHRAQEQPQVSISEPVRQQVSHHALGMAHYGMLWNDKVRQGPDPCSEITLSRRTQPLTILPQKKKVAKK